MTQWHPSRGTQLGPAWRAITDNLSQRKWGSEKIAAEIAIRACGIQRKTAVNLVADAIRHGYLEARDCTTTRGRRYRQVRLLHAGPAR